MKGPQTFTGCISLVSEVLVRTVRTTSGGGRFVAAALLFVLVFYVTADVISRTLFRAPLKGTLEVSQIMLLIIILFAVAYTQASKGHVRIELFSRRWSPRSQAVLGVLSCIAGIGLFSLMVRHGLMTALADLRHGVTTDQLGIPLFLAKLVIPVGASLMIMELIVGFLSYFQQLMEHK